MTHEASITAYPDGPLIVRGEVAFYDEAGDVITQPRRTAALCRCGLSAIKPWCDGTHKLSGFTTDGSQR
jgi:CDGSH-type Zn-finger protein